MHRSILLVVLSFLLLTGCASHQIPVRHKVALSSDSERIAYDVVGSGKTALVFIHGWSCDGRYWQQQIPAFAGDYQVITVDLAGHGHSSVGRSDYSMVAFAHDVKAIVDQERIERAILVGHSMGGAVIAEAARLMPVRVVGVIGVDTLQNVAERIPQSVVEEMAQPFEADFTTAAKDFVAPMFPEGADETLVAWVKEDMSSAPKAIALNAFRNYLERYVTGEAATAFDDVRVPVISINARLWPTALEENRKHIDDYQLMYIEDAGHFPMLERPEAFNELLKQAIDSIEEKGSKPI